jgi:hypothetical protein
MTATNRRREMAAESPARDMTGDVIDVLRAGRVSPEDSGMVMSRLMRDWPSYRRMVDDELLARAGTSITENDRVYGAMWLEQWALDRGTAIEDLIELHLRLDEPSAPNHRLFEQVARALFPGEWEARLVQLARMFEEMCADETSRT